MGTIRSPLHGIPIFIKGNMATSPDLEMSTSFGAYAFQNATSDHDAFIVSAVAESKTPSACQIQAHLHYGNTLWAKQKQRFRELKKTRHNAKVL